MPAARVTVYRRNDDTDQLRVTAGTTVALKRTITVLSGADGVDEVVAVFEEDGEVIVVRRRAGYSISMYAPPGTPGSAADARNDQMSRAMRLRAMRRSDREGGPAASDEAISDAVRAFAAAYSTDLAVRSAENMACAEAAAAAGLLRVAGDEDAADRLLAAHAAADCTAEHL